MEYLPQEISLDIFSRLPVGSLFHCRRVSCAWHGLVQHPSLLSLHSALHDSHTNPSLIFLSTKLYYFELVHIHDAGDELKLSENIENIPFKSKINVLVNDVISCNGLPIHQQCCSIQLLPISCNVSFLTDCSILPTIILAMNKSSFIIL